MRLIALFLILFAPLAAQSAFETPITAQDRADVAYIITTLANRSTPALLFQKGKLNAAGDRIRPLATLQFLEIIFTNPQLSAAMTRIRRKNFVWNKHFMKGIRGGLDKAANEGQLTPAQVDEFAATLGIKPETILPAIEARQWDTFVDILISEKAR